MDSGSLSGPSTGQVKGLSARHDPQPDTLKPSNSSTAPEPAPTSTPPTENGLSSSLDVRVDSDNELDDNDAEEERTNPGYSEWKKRRKEWTKGQEDAVPKPSILNRLTPEGRITAYTHLVLNNRKCKSPLPLADVLVILKAGWIASGQWPPE